MIGSTHKHVLPKIVDLERSVLDESELDEAKKTLTTLQGKLKQLKDEAKVEKAKSGIGVAESEIKRIEELYEKERYEEGFWKFKEKVLISYHEPGARPPHWFEWCRYDNRDNYRHLSEWRYQFGHVPVTRDDPFWPENVPLNENGHYVIGDLCLVRCRLIDHLKRRWEETESAKKAGQGKIDEFEAAVKTQGDQIEQSLIQELIG